MANVQIRSGKEKRFPSITPEGFVCRPFFSINGLFYSRLGPWGSQSVLILSGASQRRKERSRSCDRKWRREHDMAETLIRSATRPRLFACMRPKSRHRLPLAGRSPRKLQRLNAFTSFARPPGRMASSGRRTSLNEGVVTPYGGRYPAVGPTKTWRGWRRPVLQPGPCGNVRHSGTPGTVSSPPGRSSRNSCPNGRDRDQARRPHGEGRPGPGEPFRGPGRRPRLLPAGRRSTPR
jgi:hypothetical protein